ncbi:hypothetical protein N0V94_009261, partial [Neodidymelliopsis sp. IMI 364377]
ASPRKMARIRTLSRPRSTTSLAKSRAKPRRGLLATRRRKRRARRMQTSSLSSSTSISAPRRRWRGCRALLNLRGR